MSLTLKAARVNKEMTQTTAAEKLGITEKTLSSYESGKSYPDVLMLKKMEILYDVEYKDLIFLPNEVG